MYNHIKRLLDIILSLFLIVVLSPLYLVISIIVRIQMGSPILFSQDRIGKEETIFKLYKFRSMTNKKDKDGNLLPDKERLTKFGIALRSTSLDELPELFMILKGDMSFVGPRPQPSFYLPYYKEQERIGHSVRGGLIPPDCILLKEQCSWEQQLEIEAEYAKNVSFIMDLKIIVSMVVIIIKRLLHSYGSDDRPMLNVYRSGTLSKETIEYWESRGIEIK